jgi:hypothetical protein
MRVSRDGHRAAPIVLMLVLVIMIEISFAANIDH